MIAKALRVWPQDATRDPKLVGRSLIFSKGIEICKVGNFFLRIAEGSQSKYPLKIKHTLCWKFWWTYRPVREEQEECVSKQESDSRGRRKTPPSSPSNSPMKGSGCWSQCAEVISQGTQRGMWRETTAPEEERERGNKLFAYAVLTDYNLNYWIIISIIVTRLITVLCTDWHL